MQTLEVWFEFASTYSYPAVSRVESIAKAARVDVAWRPFLLGPIFRDQGWNDSPFNIYPAKGRYMWRDMERICERQRLPFRRPSTFPRNGLAAARLAARFESEAWMPAFVRGVYSANFSLDEDISDAAVLARLLDEAGAPAGAQDEGRSDDAKALLRASTEDAAALGLFGAPSFTVGSELFWGNDRMEDAFEWAAAGGA